jgi:plastocyanin
MPSHIYNAAAAAITVKKTLHVQVVVCDEKGEPLFRAADVELQPGDSVTWQYPPDGLKVEMA